MISLLPTVARGRLPVFIFALLALALPVHADPKVYDYDGHYELLDGKSKSGRSFSLDVKQTHSRAEVTFSAAMDDGSGAAPDGTGKGRVEDGVLSFEFKDSFNNEGTCTLEAKKDGYHLDMVVIKVVDPGPFHFYGNILLKRTSPK